MNLPNKLTMLRILLIPVFMVVLYWDFPGAAYVALVIFIAASLTDLLDGKIARARNLVTDFGKFADPLADKMLVTAAMLWFVECGRMPAWMLLIVICREFAVSGLRMIASDKGRVIAAGWSGKVKTASTMVCIVVMLLLGPEIAWAASDPLTAMPIGWLSWIDPVCGWIITLTTLYSGVEYFMKNKDIIASF
ncbi:CDP-diacylglycerol--glycerol-3-phosphate 3-phosphatidyltransferase [uncultured Dysosmobacter sp.]|uniref:CDP-diacylglycerol--glycerol-3-phosphate 3-phosphatidyltransferase n=1 Tax=uncultured Dysosmobacter sp. TaxID=2591384 RepID=UPI00262D734C|nr:CDP-diacylglycerol--glycerol-3-phosphate 3-phosphatidyltransferase [uncultured Dysosmobacter sp.]